MRFEEACRRWLAGRSDTNDLLGANKTFFGGNETHGFVGGWLGGDMAEMSVLLFCGLHTVSVSFFCVQCIVVTKYMHLMHSVTLS